MAVETLMFKLEGLRQATQVSSLTGKTFTVGKVTTAGNGLGAGLSKWLFLTPEGASGSTVALKIEGGRQAAQLAGLAGKTVTVGQSPTVIGGTGKWLVLSSGKGAATAAKVAAASATAAKASAGATGVAAKGKVGTSMLLMQLEGTRQTAQMQLMSGKTFTVIKSPVLGGTAKGWLFMKPASGVAVAGKDIMALQIQNGTAGNLSGMVGKSFTLFKAPMAAGNATGSWIIMQPAAGVVAKGAAGAAAVAAKGATAKGTVAAVTTKGTVAAATTKGTVAAATTKGTVATGAALTGLEEVGGVTGAGTAKSAALKGGAVSKPAAKALASSSGGSSVVAAATKSGTIWNGTGMSLGLGMGLGAWGPVMLVGLVAAVGYGAYQYYQNRQEFEEDGEMVEAS